MATIAEEAIKVTGKGLFGALLLILACAIALYFGGKSD